VVEALVLGNLPPHLVPQQSAAVNQSSARRSKPSADLPERRNVFTGDEYDVMREGADGAATAALFGRTVQQGKTRLQGTTKATLDDSKTTVETLKLRQHAMAAVRPSAPL
jgi:hypothetical protein